MTSSPTSTRHSAPPHAAEGLRMSEELPPPVPALFPARGPRERLDDHLTRELALAGERIARGSVMPTLDMARFRRELAGFDFENPRPIEPLLEWAIAQLEHGVTHMTHPRYFGLFNPAANFPSQCADRIAGAFNPQLASSGSSPAPVEIEAHVIRAFARRAGLPAEASGHFTTSGSEANYTALVCALTRAEPRFGEDGVRAFAAPLAMYTSCECHPAWFKIVHQAGVGRAALRLIATDGHGRMDARALAQRVAQDRQQGLVPVLISATAGTTGGGMVDPLAQCAQIAREHGLWCHVDAAWGGAALCSDGLRDVHHQTPGAVERGISRPSRLHALQCAQPRSLPEQRAVVAALHGPAPVSGASRGWLAGLCRTRGAGRGGGRADQGAAAHARLVRGQ